MKCVAICCMAQTPASPYHSEQKRINKRILKHDDSFIKKTTSFLIGQSQIYIYGRGCYEGQNSKTLKIIKRKTEKYS